MIDKILCLLTGRRFRFACQLRYTPDANNGTCNSTREVMFATRNRKKAINDREIKKAYASQFIAAIPKRWLRNGKYEVINLRYLGWF